MTESPAPGSGQTSPTQGVEGFVEQYLQVANSALSQPEALGEWRTLFSDSCNVCRAGYEAAASIHADSKVVTGGRLIDWSLQVEPLTATETSAFVDGTVEAATVVAPDGTVVANYERIDAVTVVYTVRQEPNGKYVVVSGDLLG